ncbi:MAG: phosphatidylglycerophosphatase A [Enterobacterales bacterium]|nr:phosphatidylglycerophosphatase A [Enterobacterales bacterium]
MQQKIPAKFVFSHPIHFLSFGFGSGLAPKAPGTFGTLSALPIYYFMADLSLLCFVSATFLMSLVGIYLCDFTAKGLVRQKLSKYQDHGGIVWDEICGYLVTMIGVAFSWQNMLLGFLLFRLFDILKPWPISWLDKSVKGGYGIMIDDIVAGLMAMISLHYLIAYVI